jgi:FtsH-binding integral membrane protein
MGSFLMMGVIGLILASVVNIFLGSSMLQFAISVIGVLVFVGLVAYDTQKLKHMYAQFAGNAEMIKKSTIMGALALYIDFIVIFQHLLQLLGDRR